MATDRGPVMHAMAYASSALRALSDSELERLKEEEHARNAALAITGVLLYCDGNLMHYFEGTEDVVRATWARVAAWPWHRPVTELMDLPIAQREFDDWHLVWRRSGAPAFLPVPGLDGAKAPRLGPGAELLRIFWGNCRA